ncbi:MAG: glycosyltransferase family 4 protein [Acidobacteriota bacterium]
MEQEYKKILEILRKHDIPGSEKDFKIKANNLLSNLYLKEDTGKFSEYFLKIINLANKNYGTRSTLNLIYNLEVRNDLRKPKLAIYDHAFHFIGGAQKYGLTLAKALEDKFEITIISNKNVTLKNFREWYGIDFTSAKIEIIPLPWFEQNGSFHIEPHRVTKRIKNPFHRISRESGKFDIFINNGMLEMVYPLSPVSIMVCHFPERRPESYFYSDLYTYTIYNSEYTGHWIEKRWKYKPHKHIYPPVDMEIYKNGKKKNIILSVARFEEGGTKKQFEMAKTFLKLKEINPETSKGWKLILAGGSPENNPYLEKIRELVKEDGSNSIEIKVNISGEKLKNLYKESKIFWHLCGLGQSDPAKVEHFGMTIRESMQNNIVPIVFNGGGQREIVKNGISGFRVNSLSGLIKFTLKIMNDETLREKLGKGARLKSREFNRKRFDKEVKEFFKKILTEFSN